MSTQHRSQPEWNKDCIESAIYKILPSAQPSQTEPRVVSWQEVQREAESFDGYTGTSELVRTLLANNELDIVKSEEVENGYRVKKSL